MNKPLTHGQIVHVQGGKYHGQGAQVRKIDAERGRVAVLIAGKIVNLKMERVQCGQS